MDAGASPFDLIMGERTLERTTGQVAEQVTGRIHEFK